MQSSDYTVKVRETSHNVTTNIVSVQHGLTDLGGCVFSDVDRHIRRRLGGVPAKGERGMRLTFLARR